MVNDPFELALRRIVSAELSMNFKRPMDLYQWQADGDSSPSFVSYCLQNLDHGKDVSFQKRLIQNTAGTMFVGMCATIY